MTTPQQTNMHKTTMFSEVSTMSSAYLFPLGRHEVIPMVNEIQNNLTFDLMLIADDSLEIQDDVHVFSASSFICAGKRGSFGNGVLADATGSTLFSPFQNT